MRLVRPITRTVVGSLVTAVVSTTFGVGLLAPAGSAGVNPYARGPEPTQASIEATTGAFAVASKVVSRKDADGFGGGTIWYPTATGQGRFGVVAISPGFGAGQAKVAWLGPRIASQGFVVVTIETNTLLDGVGSRGKQLLAALDEAIGDPTVSSRIDSTRQAVIGSSMGGGGTLEAAKSRPSLEARIGYVPFHTDKSWPEIEAASLEIGSQDDGIAAPKNHALKFHDSQVNAERRAFIELRGEDHYVSRDPNVTLAKYTIAWLKWFVDNDVRYAQFFTPGPTPATTAAVSDYRLK